MRAHDISPTPRLRSADINPFAACRFAHLNYMSRYDDVRVVISDFETIGRRASIVGPNGCGKSTLARHMLSHYRALGFQCIRIKPNFDDRKRSFMVPIKRRILDDSVVLIDGWESLRPSECRLVNRRCQKVYAAIAITHGEVVWPILRRLSLSIVDFLSL